MSGIPRPQTLKKYGLTELDWLYIIAEQGYCCAICGADLRGKRTNIDHMHRKGWKQLSSEKRKLYVRGILCWTCNKLIVGRGVTIPRLENALVYMKSFEERRPK